MVVILCEYVSIVYIEMIVSFWRPVTKASRLHLLLYRAQKLKTIFDNPECMAARCSFMNDYQPYLATVEGLSTCGKVETFSLR